MFQGRQVADEVGRIIQDTMTREHLYQLFSRLHFPAPPGTELYTAAPVIRNLLEELRVPVQTFSADFLGLEFPEFRAPSPACRPSAPPSAYPATVVRWCGHESGYPLVGSGTVRWTTQDIRPHCTLDSLEGTPEAGERVVYAPHVALDGGTGLLTGKADNRAGVAACVAMCDALSRIARHLGVSADSFHIGVLFPGQEEGSIGTDGGIELAFARDSRAAGLSMAVSGTLPRAWINVDGHEVDPPAPSGLYAGVVSEGRGTIVPPHLMLPYRGFSIRNPHYNGGLPTTHIDSVYSSPPP